MVTQIHLPTIESIRGRECAREVESAGKRIGDNVEIEPAALMKILAGCKRQIGLGDIVEAIAKPVAKVLRLPCLDAKGNLKPESGCAKRKAALNKAFPITNHENRWLV